MAIFVALTVQYASSRDIDWGMQLDVGLAGNYEDAYSKGNAHMIPLNLLAEVGGGFYVSRFSMRGYVDIGTAVRGEVEIGEQTFTLKDHIEDYIFKVGAEFGIKIIDTSFFGFGIPIGWSFNYSEFKKPDGLDLAKSNMSDYEMFCFLSHTIYSGLNFSFEISDYFSLLLFARSGLPVSQYFTFIGLKDASANNTAEYKAEIFEVTFGLIFRIKLFGYSGIISTIF